MSIDSINFSTKTPAFKGNYKRTEQGNPYYHTNSAMKIGGTLAGLCALGTAIDLAGNNFFQKALKNLPEADKDLIKINNKTAILANGLAALAIHLGCAAFIDHKRNEKAKETADFVKKVGTKNAVMNSDEVALSNKGRAYYDSNTGAKYGVWCGTGAGLVTGILGYAKELKKLDSKTPDVIKTATKTGGAIGIAMGIGISALGGWLLGKWADSIANNDARKHA
ncbi:TPA: hypothetical protein CPT92_09285 [Candidatus Gastranaerophilales bacterium HUM_13]|jgi:hypothetical protein|nr:MAG TPA: hypothetical protein CPT99_02615 [Candidatus Gastranaerophilales bacterium HUM_4]DAA88744.1 MAG TPA: hypothetical protein CPT87_10675 [Candidatus Gastranaerophilales bacterium HUM_5]DAB05390.1 MAG TPA: hypothetical protein CPT92_09285 [Candidatus Gastranaerophilales bacterium HUM_13]